ncbi:YitT family protein [Streptacidiphilus sp. EB129]|uniref:membrane protein YczE n=1 Tax=Streptacidiphilus sp. EB129 TaxID=3156262 RepID=UPI003512DA67
MPHPWTAVRSLLPGDRPARRLVQLNLGLVLYGASTALLLRSGFGVDPWTVLHQGLHQLVGLSVGTVSILVSLLVLACWIPLRQRPGIGTVLDAVLVGVVIDATLACTPTPHVLWTRGALLLLSVLLNGIATGCYIGAGLGAGPRDGLMTGLAARGHSTRLVRTGIELAALGAGWLLGGPVGLGTLVYALAIGPLAQVFLPLLAMSERPGRSAGRGRRRSGVAPVS